MSPLKPSLIGTGLLLALALNGCKAVDVHVPVIIDEQTPVTPHGNTLDLELVGEQKISQDLSAFKGFFQVPSDDLSYIRAYNPSEWTDASGNKTPFPSSLHHSWLIVLNDGFQNHSVFIAGNADASGTPILVWSQNPSDAFDAPVASGKINKYSFHDRGWLFHHGHERMESVSIWQSGSLSPPLTFTCNTKPTTKGYCYFRVGHLNLKKP